MDVHFNMYKVKYRILDGIIDPIRKSQYINSINIFINLDDFFHSMHKPTVDQQFHIAGQDATKQFMSNIINLIAHYRYWGAIKKGMKCKVYAYYTSYTNSFKNRIYINDYRKHFRSINSKENAAFFFLNTALHSGMEVLPTILNYVPDVYVIDSKYLESSIIPLYIYDNVSKADWNFVISRDTYDLQYTYRDKWSVVAPKGEASISLDKLNIWNYVNERERIYSEYVDLHYPNELYIWAKALVGDKYRSIPRLRKLGWKTVFKFLNEVMETYGDSSPVILQEEFIKLLVGKKVSQEEWMNNLYTISIPLQVENIMNIDETAIKVQIQDIPDLASLQKLNRETFYNYPLNLEFLCNELKDISKKNKNPFD